MHSIIREPTTPTTPQRHQSQSRQNERDARDLGSPENRRTPVLPSQRITFHGQQYDNLPEHVIMGMQRVQALEQASVRARGSLHCNPGNQTVSSAPQVVHHKIQMLII